MTDKPDNSATMYKKWKARIEAADKYFTQFEKRGEKIVKRYRDDREGVEDKRRKFNILYSNVEVMKPALYGRKAKPQVSRRFKDSDPVGRVASLILERGLEYEVEQYPHFDTAMKSSVEDRLLPGRGTAWVRYEPHMTTEPQVSDSADANLAPTEKVEYECAPTDYVYWKDFSHSPARTWEEVTWVRRIVYLSKDECEKRFGEELAEQLQFNADEMKSSDDKNKGDEPYQDDKKAKISEIWDKTTKRVTWLADDCPVLLDERDDPLLLDDFFPCPKPLYSNITTGSLIPVPDYTQYQDQAEEMDTLTQRIWLMERALKVVGIFNGEFKALQRMLNEGGDNTMIPVDSWAAFAEKGGIKGAVEFLPISEIADVLERLYVCRDQAKQVIYEIIGLADIMRGSSDAKETLGAQQLKANFGGLRLKNPQKDVAQYATDLLRLMAQVMCRHYAPETLIAIANINPQSEDGQLIPQAIELLKSDTKNFRIDVEADSLAEIDENQEKAEAAEFVTSIGGLMAQAVPMAESAPQLMPLIGEVIMFAVRKMRAGRTIESAFEKALAQAGQSQGADPRAAEEQKMQMEQRAQELEQQQAEIAKKGQELQGKEIDLFKRETKLGYDESLASKSITWQKDTAQKDIKISELQAARQADRTVFDAERSSIKASHVNENLERQLKEFDDTGRTKVGATLDNVAKKGDEQSEVLAAVMQSVEAIAERLASVENKTNIVAVERVRGPDGRVNKLKRKHGDGTVSEMAVVS